MGLSVTSCVDDEGTSSYLPEHPNRPLPSSVIIRYRAWSWRICNLPYWKFSGFRNCVIVPVTPIMGNIKVSWSKPLAHAGTYPKNVKMPVCLWVINSFMLNCVPKCFDLFLFEPFWEALAKPPVAPPSNLIALTPPLPTISGCLVLNYMQIISSSP